MDVPSSTELTPTIVEVIKQLQPWMIFIVVILLIFSPLISELVRQIRNRKQDNKLKEFTESVKISVSENQMFLYSFKDYLEELYTKLDLLLNLLYEKYANNLTLDIAKSVTELVLERSCNKVLSTLTEYISDSKRYDDMGNFMYHNIEIELNTVINNRYYADIMTLNKVTCKNVTLDLYLLSLDPNRIKDDIIEHFKILEGKASWELHFSLKKFLEAYYLTLINKAQSKLEEQVKTRI